ncbi:MAG: PilZ domain-containing protein [Spirochaetia bacterium]|nr:PilZ domain-containing protein [Spirochaetia bacterium]
MTDERRRFPRLSSNFSLEVKPATPVSGQNISKGGLMFTHPAALDPGSVVQLVLRVPSLSGSVDVKAKVIRCERASGPGYNVAVNFVDLEPDQETQIEDFVNSFK